LLPRNLTSFERVNNVFLFQSEPFGLEQLLTRGWSIGNGQLAHGGQLIRYPAQIVEAWRFCELALARLYSTLKCNCKLPQDIGFKVQWFGCGFC